MMQQTLERRRIPIRFGEALAVLAFVAVLTVSVVSWPAMGGGRPPSGIEQVYIMNTDGTGLRSLSPNPNEPYTTPAWSPDGRHLVMSVGGGEDFREPAHLWIVDLETGEMRQLTSGEGRDHGPSWSPDGTTIAFVTHDLPIGSAPSTLYSIHPDGTGLTQLTDGRSQTTPASWSPDSSEIAFGSDRDGTWQLYVMNADGTNPRKLDTGPGAVEPDWSPDGRTIAYMADVHTNVFDVYTLDFETGETRQLTDTLGFDGSPHWSPDGTKIAFISERNRRMEVFVMNADGSDQRNLSAVAGKSGIQVDWSPDGSRIVIFGLFDPAEKNP